ncbi:MAG: hypothetical protein UU47_C0025G0005 [candidate division TM6 bacterium GW2011_GWE2_41_16]|nr:MAG: hypothetical protein UU47_C0025G0005 [candidate division TM6 bacterium GW2011_GWE2_41_16]
MKMFIKKIISVAREFSSLALWPLITVVMGCFLFFTVKANVYEAFVFPAFFIFIAQGIPLLFNPRMRKNKQAISKSHARLIHILNFITLASWLVVICIQHGYRLSTFAPFKDVQTVTMLFVGIMLIVIGNYVPKIQHASLATVDLNTQSTQQKARLAASHKANRLFSIGYMATGIAIIASLIFLPYKYAYIIFLGTFIPLNLCVLTITYLIYRHEMAKLKEKK